MAGAVTATLRADITQFEKALGDATTKITGLQKSTSQVNAELRKFGNEFSGANLIRQANTMAQAVKDIGGATNLTAAEQRRLAGTVEDALLKYRALGQEVPPALAKLATELKEIDAANEEAAKSAKLLADQEKRAAAETSLAFEKAGGAAGAFKSTLGAVGTAVGAAFTIGAVINFGKSIVDLGSQITDLSQRTGLSVKAVQEFKYAADQTGSSIETFANATTKLSDKLVSGDKGAVQAVKELGLSLAELRTLSPEDAFTQVADAVGRIPDPMKQTQLALDLFGKSGAEILPAIKQGFSGLRDEANKFGQVLSDEDVKALDDFGDHFGQVMTGLKVSAARATIEIAAGFKSMFTDIAAGLDVGDTLKDAFQRLGKESGFNFAQAFRDVFKQTPVFGEAIDAFLTLQQRGREARAVSDDDPNALSRRAERMDAAMGIKAQAVAYVGYIDQLKAARAELAKLTSAERDQIRAGKEVGDSNDEVAAALNRQHDGLQLTAGAIDIFIDREKAAADAAKQTAAELEKQAAEITRMGESLSGLAFVDDANTLLHAIEQIGSADLIDPAKAQGAIDLLERAIDTVGRLGFETTGVSSAQVEAWGATVAALKPVAEAYKDNAEMARNMATVVKTAIGSVATSIEAMVTKSEDLQEELRKIANNTNLTRATQGMSKGFKDLAKATLDLSEELRDLERRSAVATPELKKLFDQMRTAKIEEFTAKFGTAIGKVDEFRGLLIVVNTLFPQLAKGIGLVIEPLKGVGDGFKGAAREAERAQRAMEDFGLSIGQAIGDAVKSGEGFAGAIKGIGEVLSHQLQQAIARGINEGFKASSSAEGAAKGSGINTGRAFAAGLATAGAGFIFSVAFDVISGYFTQEAEKAADAIKAAALRSQIRGQFGGTFGRTSTALERAKVPARDANIILNSNSTEAIASAWTRAQEQLQLYQAALGGLSSAMEGVAKIGQSLGMSLGKSITDQEGPILATQKAILDGMKAAGATAEEIAAKTAQFAEENKNRVFEATEGQIAQYNRLGLIAGGVIANMVGRTGDLVGALREAGPAIEELIAAQEKFGLTEQTSAATQAVIDLYGTIKNNEDVFASISGIGQVMTGFGDALIANTELANAFGQELAADLATLEERGVSTAVALASMAPQLQTLWELAKSGKVTVDETTKALLAQAEAQGIVGESMRSVDQQILNVLTEIKDLFSEVFEHAVPRGAAAARAALGELPPALNAVTDAATETGAAIGDRIPAGVAVARASLTGLGQEELSGLSDRAAETGAAIGAGIAGGTVMAGGSLGALRKMSFDEFQALAEQGQMSAEQWALAYGEAAGDVSARFTELADQGTLRQLATQGDEVAHALVGSLGGAATEIGTIFDDLGVKGQEAGTQILTSLTGAADGATTAFSGIGTAVHRTGTEISGIFGDLSTVTGEQFAQMAEQADRTGIQLRDSFDGTTEFITNSWVRTGVESTAAIADFSTLSQEQLTALGAKGQDVGFEILTSLTDAAKGSTEALGGIGAAADETGAAISDAFGKAAIDSAKAVADANFAMVESMERLGRVTKEEADKMRQQIERQFAEAARSAQASIWKIPKKVPIEVDFKLKPFPDIPDPPPVVIPIGWGDPGPRPTGEPENYDPNDPNWRPNRQPPSTIDDTAADEADAMSEAFGQAAVESARSVAHSNLDMVDSLERLGRVTADEAHQMREAIATQFEEAARSAIASLATIPTEIPVEVNFTLSPFPDVPLQPPVVVPVEFEMPEGRTPWDEGYGRGGPSSERPPQNAAFGAYIPARPGGTIVRVGEAGRDEVITPVDQLTAAPSEKPTFLVNVSGTIDGREFLRFTARELPRYIQTRTPA